MANLARELADVVVKALMKFTECQHEAALRTPLGSD
jgi:hypothetical protein